MKFKVERPASVMEVGLYSYYGFNQQIISLVFSVYDFFFVI